jgi:hypothetical protein
LTVQPTIARTRSASASDPTDRRSIVVEHLFTTAFVHRAA